MKIYRYAPIILAISGPVHAANQCSIPPEAKPVTLGDIYRLVDTFSGNDATKSEFETTSDYQQRLAASRQPVTNANFSVGDIVVFEMPIGDRMTYDADRQLLKITNLGVAYNGLMPIKLAQGTFHGIAIETRMRSRSSYAATNAFGAQVEVDLQEVDLVAIAWPKGAIKIKSKYKLSFPNYPSQAAKELRERGLMRVIGKVMLPVIGRAPTYGASPTISQPFERRNTFAAFTMVPTDVCVVDATGGVMDAWTIQTAKQ